jgi:hypothetical protein
MIRRRIPLLAVAAVAVLALAACGSSGSPNWYANGKAFAVADYNAGDTASLVGVLPSAWCAADYADFGGSGKNGLGVPLNGPPAADNGRAQWSQWVNGCAAGYYATNG